MAERLAGWRVLARASWTLWRRHTAHSLGASTRVVDVGIAIGLLLCAGLAALVSTFIAGTVAAAGTLPADIPRTPYLRITAAGAIIGGALPQLLLAATRPRGSALGDLAAVLPVGTAARALGERAPTVLLGLGFSIVLTTPLGTMLVALHGADPARAVAAVALHLLLLALAALAAPAAFELLAALAARMRLPHGYAVALAAGSALAAVIAASAPYLVPRPMPDAAVPLSPIEAVAQLGTTDDGWRAALAAVILVGWTAVAIGLVAVASRHPAPTTTAEYTRMLAGAPVPRGRTAAGVAVHAIALARLPQLVVLGGGSLALAVVLATPLAREHAAITQPLAGVPLIAPFAIAMFAFGLTHGTSWWVRGMGADAPLLARQRLAAAALVGAVPVALAAGVLLATGTLHPVDAAERTGAGLVLCLAASLGGVLVPWSPQSPLSTTITSAASFALFGLAVVPLQLAVDGWSAPAPVLALGASGTLLAAGWLAATRRRRVDDLVIA